MEDMECFVDGSRCFEVGIVGWMADSVEYQNNLAAKDFGLGYEEENEQEAHKVAESEAGSNARWAGTVYLEHLAMVRSSVVAPDRFLYRGVGRGVMDVLALAEGAHALGMAVELSRMSRLMATVEGNSLHPCSSHGKPSRIEGADRARDGILMRCKK